MAGAGWRGAILWWESFKHVGEVTANTDPFAANATAADAAADPLAAAPLAAVIADTAISAVYMYS